MSVSGILAVAPAFTAVSNTLSAFSTYRWTTTGVPLSALGPNDFHCGALTPGCAYRIDFNDTNFAFTVAPGNNLETFAGQVTQNNSMYFSSWCNAQLGAGDCPTFDFSVPVSATAISH